MKLPVEDGCLCGAVRYRVSAEPPSADYCHCRMCRRAAGAPVVARLTVADTAFAWTKGEPAVYRSRLLVSKWCPGAEHARGAGCGQGRKKIAARLDDLHRKPTFCNFEAAG